MWVYIVKIAGKMEIFNSLDTDTRVGFERNLDFVVGIHNYCNVIFKLNTAVNDAKKLVEVLRSSGLCHLDSVGTLSNLHRLL